MGTDTKRAYGTVTSVTTKWYCPEPTPEEKRIAELEAIIEDAQAKLKEARR